MQKLPERQDARNPNNNVELTALDGVQQESTQFSRDFELHSAHSVNSMYSREVYNDNNCISSIGFHGIAFRDENHMEVRKLLYSFVPYFNVIVIAKVGKYK